MKLEVGMYVRTKNGEIHKIKSIDDNFLKYENGFGVPLVLGGHIIKASHNIIDLIEVGDIVVLINGFCKEELMLIRDLDIQKSILDTHKIISIVTKEQFESMSYKVN